MWWWLTLACHSVSVAPADRAQVRDALVLSLASGPLNVQEGEPVIEAGYTIRPVRWSLQPGFSISGALWLPDSPGPVGVLVAHGHYGQGKSSAEAQEVAHRLAARGHTVLAVDTPGVEEWDVAGRHIHMDEGAHNRAFLAAGGTSALALQLSILQRGVDLLESRGLKKIAATGASGGATQALYLQLIDERVEVTVLASAPRVPREARASGCPCDQIPGWPGPDPSLLAAWRGPALWLSDVEQPAPEGLGSDISYEVMAGPHSFTEPMQRRAIEYIEDALGGGSGEFRRQIPQLSFSTGAPEDGAAEITDLALPVASSWVPREVRAVAHTQSCSGDGPVVVVGGGHPTDLEALHQAGFRTCELELMSASGRDWDPVDLAESISTQQPLIDRVAGALSAIVRRESAVAIWGVRGYGLAASATGHPFVVRDPVRTIDAVDPAVDAPWIHVPGGWWGGVEAHLAKAVATGTEPADLASALVSLKD